MRQRIVTLAVTAAVLAIVLFGLPLAVGVAKYNLSDERAELERIAVRAALTVTDDPSGSTPPAPADATIAVYSPAGAVLTGTGPAGDDVVAEAVRTRDVVGSTSSEIVVAVPIVRSGQVTAVVRASTTLTEVVGLTLLVWLAMAAGATAAVLITWRVARRMAARLTRPVENLADLARDLGEGDFTVQAAPCGIKEIDGVADALTATARRLGDTLERERAFTARASHQLRTPLAGLRLQLEAALEAPADPRPALEIGVQAADRLERTIDDLLTLTRDSPRPARATVELAAVLADAPDGWRAQFEVRGRVLRVDIRDAPPLAASEAAVRQILNVLVDNALVHGRGTVAVIAREAAGAFAVDVADEGSTGEADLFAPRPRAATGHGIGLGLARSLAEAEGGRLTLTDRSPTRFTLLLPTSTTD
ncbi:histidine kinase dimerization/phospho-acceptor domain-containing protein [Lentzea sp. NPDC058436]|uniref:HAMP domain-containing sensor histidine kinase n=1 Tax=Lentzea sp. NPDC058436 TaxID=3346499 RepID=UPI00365F6901